MSDPQIIQLHGLTVAQETELYRLRLKRIADDAFTGGERNGLRLSIDDPVRRVKAYFDSFWTIHIDQGIAARGYLMEDLVEVVVMQGSTYGGAEYTAQVPIMWGPKEAGSVSAFDFTVERLLTEKPVSVKSVDTGTRVEILKPSTANIRQETRMLIEAGYAVGSEWDTWVGSLAQMAVRGPFTNTLTQDVVDAYLLEQAGVAKAWALFNDVEDPKAHPWWNDSAAWREQFGLESTSGAFRFDSLDANGAVEARNRAYLRARAEASEAEREKKQAQKLIEQHVREQIALKRLEDPNAKSVVAYSGDRIATYTLTSNDQMRVTEREDKAPAISAA